MKIIFKLIFAIVFFAHSVSAQDFRIVKTTKKIMQTNTTGVARPLFLSAGQSNIDAYQYIVDLQSQYKQTFNDILFFESQLHGQFTSTRFIPLDYTNNLSYQNPNQTGRFAIEFSLYTRLQTQQNKRIYICQHAMGGTSLATDWLSSTRGSYFDDFVQKAKNSFYMIKDTDGFSPSVKFVLWGQGEADASTLASANAYNTNLTNYINNFRASDPAFTNVPFIILLINSNIDAVTFPYWATVRAAQIAVAGALTGVYTVDCNSSTLAPDNVHYTLAGYENNADLIMAVAVANGLI